MTLELDEAIKHCEKVAEKYNKIADTFEYSDCRECAKKYGQLAKWLKELKAYREILANANKIIESEYGCIIIEGYADVIDKMKEVYNMQIL